jgi:threonine dehydrogenase-like Zn-dependent dehydrogenase
MGERMGEAKAPWKMRAARICAPGVARVDEVPVAHPGPGQVRLRIEGCGVCASNLGPWRGLPWMRYPLDPGQGGHEAWGVVEDAGLGVDRAWVGARVLGLCTHAFAEYDVADAAHLVRVPPGLEASPFPGEPFACAVNAFWRSGIQSGMKVAIVGVGFLGSVLTRLSSHVGAHVVAISRRPFARKLATTMGASHVVAWDGSTPVVDEIRELTGGALCDVVVEAVGVQAALDLATALARERGRIIVAGYHQDGPRQVDMQQWNWKGLDVINAHERDPAAYFDGMRQAVRWIEDGVIDPQPLLTHRFPLEGLARALDATARRPDGFLKALVMP